MTPTLLKISRSQCHASSVLTCVAILCLLAIGVAFAQQAPVDVDPSRPWVADADGLMREGRFEAAERAYTELLGQHSDDAELWLRICVARIELGGVGPALEAAQKAVHLSGESMDSLVMLSQCQALAGDPNEGLRTLERGLLREPQNTQLLETLAKLNIGMQRWPVAVGLLRELIRIEPDVPYYHLDLGRILLTQGHFDDSITEFETGRRLGGDEGLALAMIGKAHLASGRLSEAIRIFDQSIAKAPNADALGGRATVFYLRGELEQAISEFRRAIAVAPRDPDLLFNLGNVLVQTDQLAEAEDAFRRSLQLDSGAANTHLNLAVLLIGRFAIEEAEQHLRWAVQLDPELAGAHLHLGRIAGARFRYTEAVAHYSRYRARVRDQAELARIEASIRQLGELAKESRQALASGRIHLLQMKLPSVEAARDVLRRVQQGEDFYVVAMSESELASISGVDAGFVLPTEIHESFRDAVASLTVGGLSKPIPMEGGVFVFKRVE